MTICTCPVEGVGHWPGCARVVSGSVRRSETSKESDALGTFVAPRGRNGRLRGIPANLTAVICEDA